MKILVCVKVVPSKTAWDERRNTVDRGQPDQEINSNDRGALTAALEIMHSAGAELTILSMGTLSSIPVLEELHALDVNRIVLLSDPIFAGSDSLATAKALDAAIRYLGEFDLILLGRRSSDGETGQVGPQLAVFSKKICVTNVLDISLSGHDTVCCTRLLEKSTQRISMKLPAILTICGGHTLPPPTLAGLRRAAGQRIEIISSRDIGITPEKAGQNASPTRVKRTAAVKKPGKKCRWYTSCKEGARDALELLKQSQVAEAPLPIKEDPSPGLAIVTAWTNDPIAENTAMELAGKARSLYQNVKILRVKNDTADDLLTAEAVCETVRKLTPDCVLFPATIRGRNVAPLCAAKLGAGLTADCTELKVINGQLHMLRPTFSGTLTAEIVCRQQPCLASVRPGAFACDQQTTDVISVEVRGDSQIVVSGKQALTDRGVNDARIIVSGGNGVGSKAGFQKLHRLADRLGAVVCASRAAVDHGYLSYPHQVGQTGMTVRPEIYIAFGISGAVQHMAGVHSGILIAVNRDRSAPIFQYADVGIVADWEDFADALLDEINTIGGYYELQEDIHP